MSRLVHLAAVLAATVLFASACGGEDTGNDDAAPRSGTARTIDIEMVDIAFEPKELAVAVGDEVTFRFTNNGKLPHDAFIGDRDAQRKHSGDMKSGGDGHGHGEDGGITVEPGDTESLTYTFDEAGEIEIGCHQPGHYESGMKVTIAVS